MRKHAIKSYIILIFAAVSCIALPVLCYIFTVDKYLALGSTAFSAVIGLLTFLLYRSNEKYMNQLLCDLSDLIESIMQMKSKPVFPEFDDSLLSKLQSQVIRLTDMLLQQNRTIETEKNEIKSLISDISHQLKTPVATLKMYGELLLENDTTESERAEYLAVLKSSLEKLVFLTDSLIKMSRLESGIIVLNRDKTNLNSTVLDAIMQVYHKAKEKNIEVKLKNEKSHIETVHDKRWVAEALFNILDNAVKYTENGGKIDIELDRYELFARIDITDNGMGIPEAELSKIFGRFYRGKNASSKDGIGIGLTLSRKIIIDHGGYIKVKSDAGGSVFSVFLPFEHSLTVLPC